MVAESLGQKPLSNKGKKTQKSSSPATSKRAEALRHTAATYQPQGLSNEERNAEKAAEKQPVQGTGCAVQRATALKKVPSIDAKTADRRRREWIRRLKAVFEVSVLFLNHPYTVLSPLSCYIAYYLPVSFLIVRSHYLSKRFHHKQIAKSCSDSLLR